MKLLNNDATVDDARHVFMRVDTPCKVIEPSVSDWNGSKWYEKLDVIEVVFETRQWKAVMDLGDGADEWNWGGKKLPDSPTFYEIDYPSSILSRSNSEGGFFHRKALVDYNPN